MSSVLVRIPISDHREINKIAKALKLKWGAAYQIWKNNTRVEIKWENIK